MEFLPVIITVIAVVVGAYAIIRGAISAMHRAKAPGEFICPACGSRGKPSRQTRGHILIELAAWMLFIIPGVIYSIWRHTTRYEACPACGAGGMIPVNTPRGRQLVKEAETN